MVRARWVARDPLGGSPGDTSDYVVVEPGVAVPCSLVRRVAGGGVPEPYFVEVYDGEEYSLGLELERDPDLGGIVVTVIVYDGPLEEDAERSRWGWIVDPDRCEVVDS